MLRGLSNKLWPAFYVFIFAVAGLALYSYSRVVIEGRRKVYLSEAVAELSIASDQLGSQLANLQVVVKSATRSKSQEYIAKLVPAVDYVSNCAEDSKQLQDGPDEDRALIVLRSQPRILQFQLFALPEKAQFRRGKKSDFECAITKPELLSTIFRALPETFDDVLVVSSDGTVRYQSAGIGPRVVNLDGLLNVTIPETQPDDGLRSFFTSVLAPPPTAVSSPNILESLRVAIKEAGSRKVRDATSFSNVVRVQLAGEDYFAIMQPVSLIKVTVVPPGITEDIALVGLIRSRAIEEKASVLPVGAIAWVLLGVVLVYTTFFLISCVPGKSRLQRVKRRDLALMAFCILTCCAGLTLAATHLYFTRFQGNKESVQSIEALADRMADNFEDELCNLYQVLEGMSHSPDFRRALSAHFDEGKDDESQHKINLLQKGDLAPVSYSYPFFDYVFWSCYEGIQIAKWSIHELPTPPTPMRQFPWFVDARGGQLYELRARSADRQRLLDGREAQSVYVEPLFSPNTGEFLTIMMRKYRYEGPITCGKRKHCDEHREYVGLMVAPIASLNAPVFPPGYGFSVVRRNGVVLFSSKPDRNLRENLLRECGMNERLRDAIETGFAHTMPVRYGGRDVLMHVHPFESLDGAGWSIVTYRDLGPESTMQVDTFIQTMKFMVPHGFMMLLLAAVLRFGLRRGSFPGLWPDRERTSEYLQLFGILLLIAIYSWLVASVASRTLVFGEMLVLPVVAAFLAAAGTLHRSRIASLLAFVYPAFALGNGVLNARDGLSPKYALALGVLGLAIWLLTIRMQSRSTPEILKDAGHRSSAPIMIYTGAVCLMILILAVLPTIGYYRISDQMVHTATAMRDLVSINHALERRTISAYHYYSNIKLPDYGPSAMVKGTVNDAAADNPSDHNGHSPDVSPATERFVRDSMARNSDRYDRVLYHLSPQVSFSVPEKHPGSLESDLGLCDVGSDQAASDPVDLDEMSQVELDDPYLIDQIASYFSFADLRTPTSFGNDHGPKSRIASVNRLSRPPQRFLVGSEGFIQFEYCGKWLRESTRPISDPQGPRWSPHRLAMALPDQRLTSLVWMVALLIAGLSFGGTYWLVKLLFFVDFKAPAVLPEITPEDIVNVKNSLIVLSVAGAQLEGLLREAEGIDYIDARKVSSVEGVSELFVSRRRPVVIDHFELLYDSEESARAKLIMLEDLLSSGEGAIVLVAISDPVQCIASCAAADDLEQTSGLANFFRETEPRWNRLFLSFEQRRMRFDLDGARKREGENRVARRIYASCTNAERALLYQIVTDGWVNPKNDGAISSLIARGWVELAPLPRLVDDLAFMAQHVSDFASKEEIHRWHASDTASKWAWVALFAGALLVSILLITGNGLQSIPGTLGAVITAIPAVAGAASKLRNRASLVSERGAAQSV